MCISLQEFQDLTDWKYKKYMNTVDLESSVIWSREDVHMINLYYTDEKVM